MSRGAEAPHCTHSPQAAAHALRSLGDETDAYREHLSGCRRCRAEVAELRLIVDALPAAAPGAVASAALRQRVLAAVRAQAAVFDAAGPEADGIAAPRRRRPAPRLVILAATLAAAAITAAAALPGSESPRERVTAGVIGVAAAGAHATLRQLGSRTELVVGNMPQPPLGEAYQVWLDKPGRAPQPTNALFTVTRHGNASVDVPGNLRDVQEVMVTAEPLGGSIRPTGPTVIRVFPRE